MLVVVVVVVDGNGVLLLGWDVPNSLGGRQMGPLLVLVLLIPVPLFVPLRILLPLLA